ASRRMKTMPVLASAGWNVNDTGAPEWTPIPETVARAPSVVCLPAFITPLPQPLGELYRWPRTPPHHEGVSRVLFLLCVGCAPNPVRPPSPRALGANPNTAQIAANSRFFSDCYNARPQLSTCVKKVFRHRPEDHNVIRFS